MITKSDIQFLAIWFLLTAIAYLYGSMLGLESQLAKANAQYRTQQVCGVAHLENNFKSEQACGEVQDRYNTEFVCDSLARNSHCWTEVR